MAVRRPKRLTLSKPAESKWFQIGDIIAHNIFGSELACAKHLETMIAIGNHENIRCDPVNHRDIVRGEGTNSAIASFAKVGADAFKT